MDDVVLVQKVVRQQDLVSDNLDSLKFQSIRASLQLLEQCFLNVVENEIQLAFLAEVLS